MILSIFTTQVNINTPLVNTHKLEIKQWLKKTIPNNQWFRLTQSIQLVLSHHPKTGNTMCHIKCWNQSFKRTEMVSMTSSIFTTLVNISTPLVSMSKLEIKQWLKKTVPNNQWYRLTQFIQLVLSHHPKTGNTMCHTKCWNQSFKRTEMVSMTSLIFTTQVNISTL